MPTFGDIECKILKLSNLNYMNLNISMNIKVNVAFINEILNNMDAGNFPNIYFLCNFRLYKDKNP